MAAALSAALVACTAQAAALPKFIEVLRGPQVKASGWMVQASLYRG